METKTIQEIIAESLRLCDAATPGPWETGAGGEVLTVDKLPVAGHPPMRHEITETPLSAQGRSDRQFIAHARTALPKYARALRMAYESLKKVESHGCCVMHNDSRCPGCESTKAIFEIAAILGEK